ncbi:MULTISPECIES: NmrA family NAD(P)-binding protein [Bacillaceae]|jgi:uncharacterized protein YbjT (DUF2867 family)|uniref:NmrA-like domain-containing protein n=1 Tax=Shouchella clausii TaxID=79880 RepID=A0A268RU91_SHOCL|nr:hypothetical protein CHH74_21015 [Shouchella clausii]PAD40805.1 hypothetical protein CHH54_20440 [Bacillus sp. 7520-S]PAE96111.1 hypothetical protein CHH71_13695 [Shouchella clausii]PAF23819.1 hypothetical protein CHH61_21850 [Shouchella clausii]
MQWTFVQPVGFMGNAIDNWQESIKKEGGVREFNGDSASAIIHEEDIAEVFVHVLTEDGHHEKLYTLTGPETLSIIDQVNIISEAIGKEIPFVELSKEEAIDKWKQEGYDDESIAFFIEMTTNTPEIGYTVLPTVEELTGRPAKTFKEWAKEHKSFFI